MLYDLSSPVGLWGVRRLRYGIRCPRAGPARLAQVEGDAGDRHLAPCDHHDVSHLSARVAAMAYLEGTH